MKLRGRKLKQIQQAILDGYPSKESLEMMIRIKMDIPLDNVATGDTLSSIVFALIKWAESTGQVRKLILSAHENNTGNPSLKLLADEFTDEYFIDSVPRLPPWDSIGLTAMGTAAIVVTVMFIGVSLFLANRRVVQKLPAAPSEIATIAFPEMPRATATSEFALIDNSTNAHIRPSASKPLSQPITSSNTTSRTILSVQKFREDLSDPFEIDNNCIEAHSIPTDETFQFRTFHNFTDRDWVYFETVADQTYLIRAEVPYDSGVDIALQVYLSCDSGAVGEQNYPFSQGARLHFRALKNGKAYLNLRNQNASKNDDQMRYVLTVRALHETGKPGVLILVAGSISPSSVQNNISSVANSVHKLFVSKGYSSERVMYLGLQQDSDWVDASANRETLKSVITEWTINKVGPERPLTLYMIGHGELDKLFLNQEQDIFVTPSDMNHFLGILEENVSDLLVNVIIEANHSGSFLEGTQSLAKDGRVIITSTDSNNLTWASLDGAIFSDYFINALGQDSSLYRAYHEARTSVRTIYPDQLPLINGDNNNVPGQAADVAAAAIRGFTFGGTLSGGSGFPPYITDVDASMLTTEELIEISAEVRGENGVERVWAAIYKPNSTSLSVSKSGFASDLSSKRFLNLFQRDDDLFVTIYSDFDELDNYRIVVYAQDSSGMYAQPRAIDFTIPTVEER